jgi:transposase-like protein
MVMIALKCPVCGSEDVLTYGTSNGEKRYACTNPVCSHKTFHAECSYNGCNPDVKKNMLKWVSGGAGVRR